LDIFAASCNILNFFAMYDVVEIVQCYDLLSAYMRSAFVLRSHFIFLSSIIFSGIGLGAGPRSYTHGDRRRIRKTGLPTSAWLVGGGIMQRWGHDNNSRVATVRRRVLEIRQQQIGQKKVTWLQPEHPVIRPVKY